MTPKKADVGIQALWYGRSPLAWLLLPLSWLYSLLFRIRALLFRIGLLRTLGVDAPVIVTGNLTVGGTGKTPVTIWLCEELRNRGFKPGIVSRGYGGEPGPKPVPVFAGSDTALAGDEAVLIARRTGCPVVVHPDRVAAATTLLDLDVDIVLADDGLQHRRLARDYEIAVVDGARGFGNGFLLPAGPLREPVSRLKSVDLVLEQTGPDEMESVFRRQDDRRTVGFRLVPTIVRSIDDSEARSILDFSGQEVHAVAAIGNPQRFFRSLEKRGIKVIGHALRDHAAIALSDITFMDDLPVMMTEKDAVKCRGLDTQNCWYVSVDVEFSGGAGDALIEQIIAKIGPRDERRIGD